MLKSVSEHNEDVRRLNGTMLTGVACSNCGNEMQFRDNTRMLSSPMQADIICFNCGNTDRIYV